MESGIKAKILMKANSKTKTVTTNMKIRIGKVKHTNKEESSKIENKKSRMKRRRIRQQKLQIKKSKTD